MIIVEKIQESFRKKIKIFCNHISYFTETGDMEKRSIQFPFSALLIGHSNERGITAICGMGQQCFTKRYNM